VQQGARQFEIWSGKPAPVAEMAYVVTKTLERRAAEESAAEPVAPARKTIRPAAKKANRPPAKKATRKTVKAARR
jgi:3-dehydroquinate dehydratase/shikimate dehydrogenase